jgi:hypothetical protein
MFHLSEVESENALIFEDLVHEASNDSFQSKKERPLSLLDYEVPKYFTEGKFLSSIQGLENLSHKIFFKFWGKPDPLFDGFY